MMPRLDHIKNKNNVKIHCNQLVYSHLHLGRYETKSTTININKNCYKLNYYIVTKQSDNSIDASPIMSLYRNRTYCPLTLLHTRDIFSTSLRSYNDYVLLFVYLFCVYALWPNSNWKYNHPELNTEVYRRPATALQ